MSKFSFSPGGLIGGFQSRNGLQFCNDIRKLLKIKSNRFDLVISQEPAKKKNERKVVVDWPTPYIMPRIIIEKKRHAILTGTAIAFAHAHGMSENALHGNSFYVRAIEKR